jgi:DNA-binding CsgD family transcriptional regulator
MASSPEQAELFPGWDGGSRSGSVEINGRCRLRREALQRVILVAGLPFQHYVAGDRMAEAYAMVSLVEQGYARQTEVARAFGCDERTVRRHQRRFAEGGLSALGRPGGYPDGRRRVAVSRDKLVGRCKAAGESNRGIARRLGIDEKAVRKTLQRLGWPGARQGVLPFEDADPNLSGVTTEVRGSKRAVDGPGDDQHARADAVPGADPNLSGDEAPEAEPTPLSLDPDGADRSADRLLACMGALDDAAAVFRPGEAVPRAGTLLAVPALLASGVLDAARDMYGSLGPAFYGLRTTLMTLLLMALLRIKRPEGLKEHSPVELGRLLGLDRAPELKTVRSKLGELAAMGRATDFGRALAERRVAARGQAMGFLYVDGHVRVYHGKRRIPKTHVARIRLSMPATTDYWVNDAEGEPLFVVSTEANRGLVKMLPEVLAEVRRALGERRVTVVFDRGGWSPKLFATLINQGFDILTYRKGRTRPIPKRCFTTHQAIIDSRVVRLLLADTGTRLRSGLRLRQVTRLGEDGHQTPIVTSRRDLSTIEVAYRMFERWRQENFFKYLREEYALDALVDYATEPADPTREVPNPARAALDAELRKAKVELDALHAHLGLAAHTNSEGRRPTMRGFKIANAPMGRQIREASAKVADLERRRAAAPTRVPVQQISSGEVVKLATERKHITDLLKMVAYQAESDLCRAVEPHYRRAAEEARTLVQSALAATGDLAIDHDTLIVSLEALSSPHRTKVLAALCNALTATRTRFPGSGLRLRFRVKPPPVQCPAFPGPRPTPPPSSAPKPDISHQG